MKRMTVVMIVFGLLFAAQAHALMFTLDGTLTGPQGNIFTSGGPYGSVSIVDNGNAVDLNVTLSNPLDLVTVISLNILGNPNNVGWSVSGGNIGTNTLAFSLNNAGWFNHFDIRVADSSANGNPLLFTLAKAGTNLDPSMFNTTASEMLPLNVYAVVRTTLLNENAYAATTVVPEPGTMMLLGVGLFGLAVYGKRRKSI